MNEEKLNEWIVRVLAAQDAEEAEGTGFWAADGYVLTCAHVLANLPQPWIAYGGNKAPVRQVETEGDIALLLVEGMSGPAAPLDQDYRIGDDTYSLGYQYEGVHGESQLGYFPISGRILGPSEIDGRQAIVLEKAYHAKQGASGAPVLNRRTGNVVGIIGAKWEQKDRDTESVFVWPLKLIYDKWKVLAPSFQKTAAPAISCQGAMETFRALVAPLKTFRWNGAPDVPSTWVGRDDQMRSITGFWQASDKRVLGLRGMGGIGKSTLIRSWCEWAQEQGIRWDGLFWWNAQAGELFPSFLSGICSYLTGYKTEVVDRIPSGTLAKVHAAADMLGAGRFLLVLDGFEELQIADRASLDFGLLKDSDVREFLRLILDPVLHNSRCLIASRVPLIELRNNHAFQEMEIERLSSKEGMTLLQGWGVSGDPDKVAEVVESYQGHPLTLSLFSTLIKKYKQGDISKAKELPQPVTDDKYYHPLHAVLRYYDDQLNQEERVLLNLFSAFRTTVSDEDLETVFRGQDEEQALAPELKALDDLAFKDLVDWLLELRLLNKHTDIMEGNSYTIHPLIGDYYYAHLSTESRGQIERHLSFHYLEKAFQAKKLKNFIESELGISLPSFGKIRMENGAFSTDARKPFIMATYHACQAEDYDRAYQIYRDEVQEGDWTLARELGAFETDLWLVRQFFPKENLEQLPLVSESANRCTLINQAGYCLKELGRPGEAKSLLRRTCQIETKDGRLLKALDDYVNLVEVLFQTGDLEDAEQCTGAMWAISDKLASQDDVQKPDVIWGRVKTLVNKAWLAHLKGKIKESDKLFRESKKLVKLLQPQAKHLFSVPGIYHATHLLMSGNLQQATLVNTWNLPLCEDAKFVQNIAACRRLQGDIARLRGNLKSASEWYNSATELVWKIGLRSEIVQNLTALGLLHFEERNYSEATKDLTTALDMAKESGYRLFEADAHVALGRLQAAQENSADAAQHLNIALSMAEASGYYWAKTGAEQILAGIKI